MGRKISWTIHRRRALWALFLIMGTLGARASALDINLLLPPPPEPAPAPAPLRPETPADTPPASPDKPEVDAPGTATGQAPGESPAPDKATVDPDAALRDKLEHIRFENFQPLPPRWPHPAGQDDDKAVLAGAGPPAGPPEGVYNEVPVLSAALADPESALAKAVRSALEGPFTWRLLDALINSAMAAARADGWSLARAYAPEQELTGGSLRIVVAAVWLEEVEVKETRWSSPKALRRPFAGLVGKPISFDEFNRAGALVNRHPFRSVGTALGPGEAQGSSRLALTAKERRPWSAFAGYDSTNSRDSGTGRYHVGVSLAVPWRTEDILTAQYAIDSDFEHLDSASLVYRAGLPFGHSLTVTGLWSRSSTLSGGIIDQDSSNWMGRLAYTAPLPAFLGWTHEVEAGWEWRRTHTESRYGNIRLTDNVVVAAPFSLAWRGNRPDRRGVWGLSFDASFGIDWSMAHMDDRAYKLQRSGADPDWIALRGELRRDWVLPGDFRARQRLWGQWSPDRLTDAGKFFLGGNRSVRGYRESEVTGDAGFAFSTELTSPSLLRWPSPGASTSADASTDTSAGGGGEGSSGVEGVGEAAPAATDPWRHWHPLDLRLAVFWDYGWVYQRSPRPAWEPRSTAMSGTGLGLRLVYAPWFSARTDYAWRLRDTGVASDDEARGYWQMSISFSF